MRLGAATARRGDGRGSARGRFGLVALEGEVGVCRERREDGCGRGETQEEGSGWFEKEGVRVRVSFCRRGVARARERRRPRRRQDGTGPTTTVSARGGRHQRLPRQRQQRDENEGGGDVDGSSDGEGESSDEVWMRRREPRFDRAVRRCSWDGVRDRGQQRGRRQHLRRRQQKDEGELSRRTSRTTSGTDSIRDRRLHSRRGQHRVGRRRFNVDDTRTVFRTVRERERGVAKPRWGDTSGGVEVSGALGLQGVEVRRERSGENSPRCRRRRCPGRSRRDCTGAGSSRGRQIARTATGVEDEGGRRGGGERRMGGRRRL